jgi:pullulanase
MENTPANVVAYTLNGAALGDGWKKVFVALNGNTSATSVKLPAGNWKVFIQGNDIAKDAGKRTGDLSLPASSAAILYQD